MRTLMLLPLLLVTACGGDIGKRLSTALGDQVKSVTVDKAKVTAICKSGSTVEIDAAELERNFLGMAKPAKVTAVGKNILKTCEEKDEAQKLAEAQREKLAAETKRLGIATDGLDEAGQKKAICERLLQQLPLKEPERTTEGARASREWSCPPPPPVAAMPTGAWIVEVGKAQGRKPAVSYLRLSTDDGDRLTLRCVGKKPDLYVQPKVPAKKGTKLVDAKLDGGKPAKWKVKPSTDGKALFFVDTKAVFKLLAGADSLELVYASGKKTAKAALPVKGFGEALKQLPKPCQ